MLIAILGNQEDDDDNEEEDEENINSNTQGKEKNQISNKIPKTVRIIESGKQEDITYSKPNKITKTVKNRDSINVTLRNNIKEPNQISKGNTEEKNESLNIDDLDENLLHNRRNDILFNLEQYTKALHNEVDYEIPKVRNGRRVSVLGYAKSTHNANYRDGCNDEINGVPTVNPSSQALFMAKLKQSETQNRLDADVNPKYASFPKNSSNRNPNDDDGDEEPSQNELHNIFPTRKRSTLLKRPSLPLMIKWARHD